MQLLQYQKWQLMTFDEVLIPPFNLLGSAARLTCPQGTSTIIICYLILDIGWMDKKTLDKQNVCRVLAGKV